MKHKVCIAVNEETLVRISEQVRKGRFDNRSHAFETAMREVLE